MALSDLLTAENLMQFGGLMGQGAQMAAQGTTDSAGQWGKVLGNLAHGIAQSYATQNLMNAMATGGVKSFSAKPDGSQKIDFHDTAYGGSFQSGTPSNNPNAAPTSAVQPSTLDNLKTVLNASKELGLGGSSDTGSTGTNVTVDASGGGGSSGRTSFTGQQATSTGGQTAAPTQTGLAPSPDIGAIQGSAEVTPSRTTAAPQATPTTPAVPQTMPGNVAPAYVPTGQNNSAMNTSAPPYNASLLSSLIGGGQLPFLQALQRLT